MEISPPNQEKKPKPDSMYLNSGDSELATWPNYNALLKAIFDPGYIERCRRMEEARKKAATAYRVRQKRDRVGGNHTYRNLKNESGNPKDRREYYRQYHARVTKLNPEAMERRRLKARLSNAKRDLLKKVKL